jgi:hypothetical protein
MDVQPGRGIRIVEQLAKKLNGSFERKSGFAGTTATVVFPYAEAREGSFEDEEPAGGEASRSLRTDRAATR